MDGIRGPYRMALVCGALPLTIGIGILALWLVTRWPWLMVAGAYTILAGLAFVVLGVIALARFYWLARSSSLPRPRLRRLLAAGACLLLVNCPAAAGAVYVAMAVTLLGGRNADYVTAPIVSPSGRYEVFATVELTDPNDPHYVAVVLHLRDAAGNALDSHVTGASHVMKWAVGWMPTEDVVIHQSSDIGNRAFAVREDRLVPLPRNGVDWTDAMDERAAELYELEYGGPSDTR